MDTAWFMSSKDEADSFFEKLGIDSPYKLVCENKRTTFKIDTLVNEGTRRNPSWKVRELKKEKKENYSKNADLDVYSLKSDNGSSIATLVVRKNINNNQVIVGIGSNPRKVEPNDPALKTITKLENTRLNILNAEAINGDSVPAKYLLQFDLSTYASKKNKDFKSHFKNNPTEFQSSVQDAYDATAFFLNAIKNSKQNKLELEYIVLGYGSLGKAILDQDVKLNNKLLIKDAYQNLFQEYQEHSQIKQFVLETYPPHSSGNYGSHGVLDTSRYFDNYFN